jgi:hypothetical protein
MAPAAGWSAMLVARLPMSTVIDTTIKGHPSKG